MKGISGALAELDIGPLGIGAWAWGDRVFWGIRTWLY